MCIATRLVQNIRTTDQCFRQEFRFVDASETVDEHRRERKGRIVLTAMYLRSHGAAHDRIEPFGANGTSTTENVARNGAVTPAFLDHTHVVIGFGDDRVYECDVLLFMQSIKK